VKLDLLKLTATWSQKIGAITFKHV